MSYCYYSAHDSGVRMEFQRVRVSLTSIASQEDSLSISTRCDQKENFFFWEYLIDRLIISYVVEFQYDALNI